MFIQTEDTPNSATMKFLPSRAVIDNPIDFECVEHAKKSPLALALFGVNGVKGVFLGTDFISVTRNDDVDWAELRPSALAAIMDHFTEGRPVMDADAPCNSGCSCKVQHAEGDAGVVEKIRELLDTRVRPMIAQDGGDVAFERYEEGIVYLRLKGACAGCPGATMTLKNGIENMLCHFIPEVKEVQRVE